MVPSGTIILSGYLGMKYNVYGGCMEERKLATIRYIESVDPIPDADAIEVVTIDGWRVVTKKGEFQPGDYCVYFEIDSFLPVEPQYEFLRKSSYKKLADGTEGFRLKTVRLRGQLSQGLALPFEVWLSQPNPPYSLVTGGWKPGTDVTEELGVTKWEPPVAACLSGMAKGNFPSHSQKSDQERVQNLKHYFDLYRDETFEMSLKLDGSSCTMYLRDGEFGVCSRNLDLQPDESNTFWKMAKKYEMEERLKFYGKNISIQGEVVGEGIQKNHEKIQGQDFYVFNVWDQELRRYQTPAERAHTLQILNPGHHWSKTIKHVPVIGYEKIFTLCRNVQELLDFVARQKAMNPGVTLEGVVFKSIKPINGEIVSFEVVSNQYLLEEK
jgi:RNA ligase (TIGR02306 family)